MTDNEKPKVSPWEAVFDTLYRSMGEWVARDKIYNAAKDVLVAMGYEDAPGYPDTGEMPGPDAPLVKAIKDLLEFAPEFGWTQRVAMLVSESDWGDSKDSAEQHRALNDREAWRAEEAGRPVYEEVVGERSGRKIKRRLVPNTGPVPPPVRGVVLPPDRQQGQRPDPPGLHQRGAPPGGPGRSTMTDTLKDLDDVVRRHVADRRKLAREHPFYLALSAFLGQVVCVCVTRRIARKLGLPLTRWQAWLLVGIFGRDPGYPYNLIWQEQQVAANEVQDAAKEAARALAKVLADARARNGTPASPPRPRRPITPLGDDLLDR